MAVQPRLVEGVTGVVRRIDPLAGRQTAAERSLAALVFAGLTRPGVDGAPRPALAERWTVEQDARVFTFTLRSGLSWHDGSAITSADVLFTVQALLARGDAADPTLTDIWSQARLTALGESQVRVELPAPFAPLPAHAAFGLLPAHLLRDLPAAGWETAPFFRAPVGAGPFRLRYLTDALAKLDAFPGYALGAPYLPGIDLRLDMRADEVQRSLAAGGIQAGLVRSADAAPTTRLLTRAAYHVILLNNSDPQLADARVRLALSMALDRPALARLGGGVPADSPFGAGWWAAPVPEPLKRDALSATRWLAEAGYRQGGDGRLVGSDGRMLNVTVLVSEEGDGPVLAQAVAEAWRVIGVQAIVESLRTEQLVTDRLRPGRFQSALVGWDPGPDPDPFGAWHSSRQSAVDGNFGRVSDAELDRLADDGRRALTLDQRAGQYHVFAQRFRNYTPGIVLFADQWVYAIAKGLVLPTEAAAGDADRFNQVHLWRMP